MITTDFLSTVTFKQLKSSIFCMTFWLFWLQNWKQNQLLKDDLKRYFWKNCIEISTFYNARIALYQYLKSLWFQKWDEILLSAYNCVSVSNAVIQAWFMPKYVDIEKDSLGIDFNSLKNSVTEKSKVILLQHTFWIPARDTKKITKFAKEKWLVLIEDVAHSFWSEIDGKKLWLFWDAAIFSSGRDKVISSVNGWFLIENSTNYLKNIDFHLKKPANILVLKNHYYNVFWFLSKTLYWVWPFGKIIMAFSRKLHLFPDIVSSAEFYSRERDLDYSLPNSLAYLLRKELKYINKYYKSRKKYSQLYQKNIKIDFLWKNQKWKNYFREAYVCKTKAEKEKLIDYMKSKWVLLWVSWSGNNICPSKTSVSDALYTLWSCPVAEDISKKILFFPNSYILSEKQVKKVIQKINNFYKNNV